LQTPLRRIPLRGRDLEQDNAVVLQNVVRVQPSEDVVEHVVDRRANLRPAHVVAQVFEILAVTPAGEQRQGGEQRARRSREPPACRAEGDAGSLLRREDLELGAFAKGSVLAARTP
jgi:hypothetical protein